MSLSTNQNLLHGKTEDDETVRRRWSNNCASKILSVRLCVVLLCFFHQSQCRTSALNAPASVNWFRSSTSCAPNSEPDASNRSVMFSSTETESIRSSGYRTLSSAALDKSCWKSVVLRSRAFPWRWWSVWKIRAVFYALHDTRWNGLGFMAAQWKRPCLIIFQMHLPKTNQMVTALQGVFSFLSNDLTHWCQPRWQT